MRVSGLWLQNNLRLFHARYVVSAIFNLTPQPGSIIKIVQAKASVDPVAFETTDIFFIQRLFEPAFGIAGQNARITAFRVDQQVIA
jgi:hypothetical protein